MTPPSAPILHRIGRHPWRAFGIYFAVSAALYQLALRAPWRPPWIVPALAFDHATPLWPPAAWIYLSYFALMPSLVLTSAHLAPERRGRLLCAAAAIVLGNLAWNLAWPTAVPRIADGPGVPWPLAAIVAGDTPGAALPSGHVSLPVGLAVLSARARLPARWLYPPWALALTASVLLTWQHVLLDALAGAAWGALAALAAAARLGVRPPPPA